MTTTSYNIYQQITSVRLGSTANLTGNYFNGALNNGVGATLTALTEGALSLDGVLVELGDRLLVKNQTDPNQNGIYFVQSKGSASGLWMIERASDFQSVEQLKVGQFFSVGGGDTLAGSMYVLVEPLPSVIGMSVFNFVDVSHDVPPTGPYLLKADNFTDVADPALAFTNLGTGSGQSITITDGDFSGGIYQISVPFPTQIVCNNLSVASQEIRLPVANDPFLSPALGQGVTLKMINCVATDVVLSDGTVIDNLEGFDQSRYICSDKSTSGGAYTILPEMYFLNALSGRVELVSNDGSVVITPNNADSSIDLSVIGGGTNINQLIYVNDADGDDANDGDINSPMKTYEAARLLAISRGANAINPIQIIVIGPQSITGAFTISPFVNVMGSSQYESSILFTTTTQLDPAWGTSSTPLCEIKDLYIFGGAYALTYPAYQSASFLRFQNCGFNTLGNFTITGSGNSGGTGVEQIIFDNCTDDVLNYTLNYVLENVSVFFINNDLSNALVQHTVSAPNSNCNLIINNCQYYSGNIHVITSSTSTLTTSLIATNTNGYTLTIDGNLNTVYVDSTSYMFTLALANGATLSNLVLPTKTDGMTNATYTPSHYTPAAGTLFAANTLTGNLKGIDNALANSGTNLTQLIYINDADGDDSNTGTIGSPLKTYAAATALAIIRGASASNPITIMAVGNFLITGNMVIYPFIHLKGTFVYDTIFEVTANVVLDSSWDSTANPFCFLDSFYLKAASIDFVFTTFQGTGANQPGVTFNQVCYSETPVINLTGSGTSTNGIFETIYFYDCPLSPYVFAGIPTFTLTNIIFYSVNSDTTGVINAVANTANSGAQVIIFGSNFQVGVCNFSCSTAGQLIVQLNATQFITGNMTIDGNQVRFLMDADSWSFTPIFTGGATVAQFSLYGRTEGINADSYSPSSYTPTGTSGYQAASQTGYNHGIDLAIGKYKLEWNAINTTMNMVAQNAYFNTGASVITLTLPATLALGDTFEVSGVGAGGWIVAQNSGQQIITTTGQTTVGVTGTIKSNVSFPKASCKLVAINTTQLKLVFENGTIDVT